MPNTLNNSQTSVLTPQEAADWLRIGRTTLQRWRKRGTGPAFTQPTSRTVYYRLEDLKSFLEGTRLEFLDWLGRGDGSVQFPQLSHFIQETHPTSFFDLAILIDEHGTMELAGHMDEAISVWANRA